MASHRGAASGNSAAALTLAELREFASFSPAAQRYIKRALDIGLAREDAFKRWARNAEETASIRMHYLVYQDLKLLRGNVPDAPHEDGFEHFMALLVRLVVGLVAELRSIADNTGNGVGGSGGTVVAAIVVVVVVVDCGDGGDGSVGAAFSVGGGGGGDGGGSDAMPLGRWRGHVISPWP